MIEALKPAAEAAYKKVYYPHITRGEGSHDRETAHERAISDMEKAQKLRPLIPILRSLFAYDHPMLRTTFGGKNSEGILLANPSGIEAGLDKKAQVYDLLGEALGLGAIKAGTITKIKWDGNPRTKEEPRIMYLKQHDAMWNWLGFPGDGSDAAVEKFKKTQGKNRHYKLIPSIGAAFPSFQAGTQVEDQLYVIKQIRDMADAIELCESSPNTKGVRDMLEPANFKDFAQAVEEVAVRSDGTKLQVIYKLSPDSPIENTLINVKTAIDTHAAGLTIANTTINQEKKDRMLPENFRNRGGLASRAVRESNMELAHIVSDFAQDETAVWYAGGLETGEDAWEALTYGGAKAFGALSGVVKPTTSSPYFFSNILRDLVRGMKAEQMRSMDDFKDLRGKKVPFPGR